METVALCFLLGAFVICILAFIKNQITYSIRTKWIGEIFIQPNWHELYKKLPKYGTTFWDMKRWTYISFEDYLKSKENK